MTMWLNYCVCTKYSHRKIEFFELCSTKFNFLTINWKTQNELLRSIHISRTRPNFIVKQILIDKSTMGSFMSTRNREFQEFILLIKLVARISGYRKTVVALFHQFKVETVEKFTKHFCSTALKTNSDH